MIDLIKILVSDRLDKLCGKSYFWSLVRHGEWLGVSDHLAHKCHLPKLIQHPICDAWDKYLGVSDDEMERTAPGGTGENPPLV